MQNRPAVGVAVVVLKKGKVLLGKKEKGLMDQGLGLFQGDIWNSTNPLKRVQNGGLVFLECISGTSFFIVEKFIETGL